MTSTAPSGIRSPWWHLYIPKLVTVLRQGYRVSDFRDDLAAGLTVAIVALPLSMALAIASGTAPANGLITVVVGGLLISLLSGSRYQVGGPAGAFVVVVYSIIESHGYDGLVMATMMAGLMLVLAGLARLGDWIKYIPQPVVTGFTAGIAVIILLSQVKDLFGLEMDKVPGEFFAKCAALWQARGTMDPVAAAVAAGSLAAILSLRRYAPKIPSLLVAVAGASLAVWAFKLDIATIGSAFGGIPRALPAPHLPGFTFEKVRDLFPSAFTIAFLGGIESLLCAVVTDGMTGRRHRSNCELVAQGLANAGSAFFGGMPATGTIARSATNVRAGAKSPVSGILHALFVLGFMLLFAPLASYIPLAALGAILVIVAWNMSEPEKFITLLRGPRGDGLVLIATFLLTVMADLTVAIQTGVVMAAILFMHRMSQAVEMQTGIAFLEGDQDDLAVPSATEKDGMRAQLPPGVEAFQVRGPLFFGVASRLIDALEQIRPAPKVFILRLGLVPMIDASGAVALEEFIRRCVRQGTSVVLSNVQLPLMYVLKDMKLHYESREVQYARNFSEALHKAQMMLAWEKNKT